MKRILITGGCGFIGSHVVRRFVNHYPDYHIYNLDLLTYAGNRENLTDIENKENYTFIQADIADLDVIRSLFEKHNFTHVIHLAAESHVDRSITDPLVFIRTNVMGTATLLQTAKESWKGDFKDKLFYHVSTDEVYGSLTNEGFFTEETPYDPKSPYSSSKASSDHLVRAWNHTYGLPVVLSNCSNNYGPNRHDEKLIPTIIRKALTREPIPIYGDGTNVRDWLYVLDHCQGIKLVLERGRVGETYNIGGHNEQRNIDVVHALCDLLEELAAERKPAGVKHYRDLITHVTDRPGHDRRYAIDSSKMARELGWQPEETFASGLKKTVQWYLENQNWWQRVLSGAYQLERLGDNP